MQAPLESGKAQDDDDPDTLPEDGAEAEDKEGEHEDRAPLRPPEPSEVTSTSFVQLFLRWG